MKIEIGNKNLELPALVDLPSGVLRRARKMEPAEQMWFLLEEVLSEKDLALADKLTLKELSSYLREWTQGVGLGESTESSN